MGEFFEIKPDLKKAILATVAFFDIFDYPLTSFEVYKWLYSSERFSFFDILEILDKLPAVEKHHGFYFLAGRKEIVKIRLARYNFAEKKFKIALRVGWWLHWLAPLKMLAVVNDLGYSNTPKQSDIDVLIITQKGRIWLTRLIITVITQLLGRRRHRRRIADRLCLSFYLSESRLNLKDIALPDGDPYLIYWLPNVCPIFDDGVVNNFWQANLWVDDFLPNIFPRKLSSRRRIILNPFINFCRQLDSFWLKGRLGEFLEKWAKIFQLQKMAKNSSSVASAPDNRVVISDEMLKFHEADRRQEFRKVWEEKLENLINK